MRQVVVIGIGNLIMKDDGLGIHAIRALADVKFPENIDLKLIDGGLELDLAVLVDEGVDKLILIDAIQAGGKPGDMYRFPINDVETSGYQTRSAHYLNMKQNLAMMQIAGNMPKQIVVIGVEPKEMAPGMELSPEIAAKLSEVVERVRREIIG